KELKPLDVLQRVQELMDLGEPVSAIRKVAKVRKSIISAESTDSIVDVVERLHKAYNFRPEAYRFVGIGDDVLRGAGVLTGDARRASAKGEAGRAPNRRK